MIRICCEIIGSVHGVVQNFLKTLNWGKVIPLWKHQALKVYFGLELRTHAITNLDRAEQGKSRE